VRQCSGSELRVKSNSLWVSHGLQCISEGIDESPPLTQPRLLSTAGVLFDDGSAAVGRQDKGLEYGCTVDAVTKLCGAIQGGAACSGCGCGSREGAPTAGSAAEPPRPPRRPLVVLHVDQLGICHAPHAKGRSWLYEQGYGDVAVYVHYHSGGGGGGGAALHRTTVERLSPAVPLIALT
jgi:hypothetical protein